MKKITNFFNGLTKWHGYALIVYSILVLIIAHYQVLQKIIVLSYWQLVFMVSVPHVVFMILRLIWLTQKRLFKMGDFVNILADERKFIVVRYHTYYPLFAVCKEVNSTDAICLHQKYLEIWQEIDKPFNINSMFKKNINTVVPTIKISCL